MNGGPIWGKLPAVVASYDGETRICTVSIPGITDGSQDLPQATLCTPIGDRATGDHATELRILAGDPVWVEFEAGDSRFPIIVGYRTPRAGNPVDWRRWRHANIEMTADGQMILNAKDLIINTETTTVNGQTTVNGNTETNGTLKNNGSNVGSTHKHLVIAVGVPTDVPG